MKKDRIKIGVIGGGMISQIAHLPFYLNNTRCEVVSVAESRSSLVSHLQRNFGIASIHNNHKELLNDSEISAVVIITPRLATAPIVLDALMKCKHVMVEKYYIL